MAEIREDVLNSNILKLLVLNYIPEAILDTVDEEKQNFQKSGFLKNDGESELEVLFQDSDPKMRMFGNAKELAENLKIFKGFTQSHVFFGSRDDEPFFSCPNVLKSEKGDLYIARNDILVMLQTFLFKELDFLYHYPEPTQSISSVLKNAETLMMGHFEFVPFDQEVIDEMFQELRAEKPKAEKRAQSVVNRLSREKLMDIYKDAFPYLRGTPKTSDIRNYTLALAKTQCIVNALEKMLYKRQHLFSPWIHQPTTKDRAVTLRLFIEGDMKFVIIADTVHSIDLVQRVQSSLEYLRPACLHTFTPEEARDDLGKEFDQIHLVPTELKFSKHFAQPIPIGFRIFVIPAADALMQILRQIILVYKVFQKRQISKFEKLFPIFHKKLFDENRGNHFFYKLSAYEQLETLVSDHFAPLENIPANDIRNVKSEGFTVENLKNELAHLGLTSVFPNITKYAGRAFDEVVKKKREEEPLKTSDMFDAVEHCQLFCVFERYWTLRKFMHDQYACHRFIGVGCLKCSKKRGQDVICDEVTNQNFAEKMDNSKVENIRKNKIKKPQGEVKPYDNCKLYPYKGVRLEKSDDVNNTEIHWKIICPDGLELYHNFSLYSIDELHELTNSKQIKFFMFDKKELQFAKRHKGLKETLSLEEFSKGRKKRLYLRMVSVDAFDTTRLVFLAEVNDILRVIRKNNELNLMEEFEGLNICPFLTLEKFEFMLEGMGIDKKLITIVPDPIFLVSRHQMIREAGFPVMTTISPDGDVVMHTDQAIFHIFQSLATRIDWTSEFCEKHKDCVRHFAKFVLDSMWDFETIELEVFVPLDAVEKKIQFLESLCNFKCRAAQVETQLFQLSHLAYDEETWITAPENSFKELYNSEKKRSLNKDGDLVLNAFEARMFMNFAFCDNELFYEKYEKLVPIIKPASLFKIPSLAPLKSFNPAQLIANPHILDFSILEQTACLKGLKRQYRPEDVKKVDAGNSTPSTSSPSSSKEKMTVNVKKNLKTSSSKKQKQKQQRRS